MKKPGMLALAILAALALAASLLLGGCAEEQDFAVREDTTKREHLDPPRELRYIVYLITMDQGSNFWQLVDEGCRKAAKELGDVNYRWIAPPNHRVVEQKECIDRAVSDGADAIVLSAISRTELDENLRRAAEAGVKIVYVDSAATHPAVATFMTDNEAAGRIAGQAMQQALAEAGIKFGMIGIASNNPEAQNTQLRVKGFRSVFEGTYFAVAPTVYMNNDRQNIKNAVKSHEGYVAFFGSNEQTTRAIAEQVKESGTGQAVIGFDTSDAILSMIQDGVIYATMQQKPRQMGHDGLRAAVQALDGKLMDTGLEHDLGINVITRDKI